MLTALCDQVWEHWPLCANDCMTGDHPLPHKININQYHLLLHFIPQCCFDLQFLPSHHSLGPIKSSQLLLCDPQDVHWRTPQPLALNGTILDEVEWWAKCQLVWSISHNRDVEKPFTPLICYQYDNQPFWARTAKQRGGGSPPGCGQGKRLITGHHGVD